MHHELNPGRCQQVEERHRLKFVARHQLAADDPGTGIQQVRCVRKHVLERDVAAEPPAAAAHRRVMEVVVCAVDRALLTKLGIEVRSESPCVRAAAPRCRADSSRAARCGSRRAVVSRAAAGSCTRDAVCLGSRRHGRISIRHEVLPALGLYLSISRAAAYNHSPFLVWAACL